MTTKVKDSKINAILDNFDSQVALRRKELTELTHEICGEIQAECNNMLARVPKNHQNMLLFDYIEMRNNTEEDKEAKNDSNDEVFESVKVTPPKKYAGPLDVPTTFNDKRSPRFLKSTLKKTATSVENLSSSRRSSQRTNKQRSVSENRAESRGRTTGRKGTAKETPKLLSGAFSAIRSYSQKRGTPECKSKVTTTPLRKCRAGESCIIISESGSPLTGGPLPTLMLPGKDGSMFTMPSPNVDVLDETTRQNLLDMHKKLSVLLNRLP